MNKVTTISTCGRCGAQEVREGNCADERVPGWALCSLRRTIKAADGSTLFTDDLCPACQEVVLEALKPPGEPICCSTDDCVCNRAGKHVEGCQYA